MIVLLLLFRIILVYRGQLGGIGLTGSWCRVILSHSWIQVDFGRTVDLNALIIQSRYQTDDRVIYVELTYSNDGNTWMGMTEIDGSRKVTTKIKLFEIFERISSR